MISYSLHTNPDGILFYVNVCDILNFSIYTTQVDKGAESRYFVFMQNILHFIIVILPEYM